MIKNIRRYRLHHHFTLWIDALLKNSSSEIAGVMDQLNPLVKESELYVKTTKPQSVNEYGTASYQQLAANKEGETRTIQFNGLSELKPIVT